jgi:hypothetical protein
LEPKSPHQPAIAEDGKEQGSKDGARAEYAEHALKMNGHDQHKHQKQDACRQTFTEGLRARSETRRVL